ncbi:hypothetical protein P6U16_26500 (plasmid) [Rhizobium sp. 32-5/1]|uniref:hypothetical protein n=1 Tax=Rhizobium sp. 32-5/1 TaxID=3019602 RepID=UPI00240E2FD1|nr:hypothetical protein [Rhizobium sp. 32-5/1]WEZ86127.1 hypothetical protein P6U16_26500 [Rhizobium sp. 32-5/1]
MSSRFDIMSSLCLCTKNPPRPEKFQIGANRLEPDSTDSITLEREYIPGPKTLTEHPDRFLNCQEAIADAFRLLTAQAVMAGWGETEVAGALVDIADCHMLSLASNLETQRMIDQAIKGGPGLTKPH